MILEYKLIDWNMAALVLVISYQKSLRTLGKIYVDRPNKEAFLQPLSLMIEPCCIFSIISTNGELLTSMSPNQKAITEPLVEAIQ